MPTTPSATEIAEAAGFDMSLVRESLALSYEQRLLQHQAALELVLEMERAGRRLRDAASPLVRRLSDAELNSQRHREWIWD